MYVVGYRFKASVDTYLWSERYAERRCLVTIPTFVNEKTLVEVLRYVDGAVYAKVVETGEEGWLG